MYENYGLPNRLVMAFPSVFSICIIQVLDIETDIKRTVYFVDVLIRHKLDERL